MVATKRRASKLSPLQVCLLDEKAKRKTYVKLAAHLGFSVAQVHGWATGKNEPTVSSLRRIAAALERDVVELLEAA